jgi:hypothetical protein
LRPSPSYDIYCLQVRNEPVRIEKSPLSAGQFNLSRAWGYPKSPGFRLLDGVPKSWQRDGPRPPRCTEGRSAFRSQPAFKRSPDGPNIDKRDLFTAPKRQANGCPLQPESRLQNPDARFGSAVTVRGCRPPSSARFRPLPVTQCNRNRSSERPLWARHLSPTCALNNRRIPKLNRDLPKGFNGFFESESGVRTEQGCMHRSKRSKAVQAAMRSPLRSCLPCGCTPQQKGGRSRA